jgi:hypothetical protein
MVDTNLEKLIQYVKKVSKPHPWHGIQAMPEKVNDLAAKYKDFLQGSVGENLKSIKALKKEYWQNNLKLFEGDNRLFNAKAIEKELTKQILSCQNAFIDVVFSKFSPPATNSGRRTGGGTPQPPHTSNFFSIQLAKNPRIHPEIQVTLPTFTWINSQGQTHPVFAQLALKSDAGVSRSPNRNCLLSRFFEPVVVCVTTD